MLERRYLLIFGRAARVDFWQARPSYWRFYCWSAASAAAIFLPAKSRQVGLFLWRPCLDTLFVNAIFHCTLLTMPKEVRLFRQLEYVRRSVKLIIMASFATFACNLWEYKEYPKIWKNLKYLSPEWLVQKLLIKYRLHRGAIVCKTGKAAVLPWFCKIESGGGSG